MKKYLIPSLSAAILSFSVMQAAPVYADHKPGHKEGVCIIDKIDHMKDKLALRPDQKEKIKAIKDKARPMMERQMKARHAIHEEVNKLVNEKNLDKMKLDKLAMKEGEVAAAGLKLRVHVKHDVLQILDQKQRDQLKEEMKKMHDKMHDKS